MQGFKSTHIPTAEMLSLVASVVLWRLTAILQIPRGVIKCISDLFRRKFCEVAKSVYVCTLVSVPRGSGQSLSVSLPHSPHFCLFAS